MYKLDTNGWSVERAVFLGAGVFVLGSVIFGFTISGYWFYFTAFVGGMLINFSLTGWCPMAILFDKLGLEKGNKSVIKTK